MAFVAPEQPQQGFTAPEKPTGFVAPDKPFDVEALRREDKGLEAPTGLTSLLSSVNPFTPEGAEAVSRQAGESGQALTESLSASGVPTPLSATAGTVASIAPDAINLGLAGQGVASLAKQAPKVLAAAKNIPASFRAILDEMRQAKALKGAVSDIKAIPEAGVPTVPLEAPVLPPTPPVTKPAIEAYVKGKMGGGISPNTGKPLPEVKIYGVRGDAAEIEKLGFGKDPASIPETLLKERGIPIAGEIPTTAIPAKAAVQKEFPGMTPKKTAGKPTELFPKVPSAVTRASQDVMVEPIVKPTGPPLPPNGKSRIAEFSKGAPDIDPYNPLTSRIEVNRKLGSLEKTAREQLQEGAKLDVIGQQRANTRLQEFDKQYKFKPGSVESAAIKVYGEAPDKLLAQARLQQAVGPEKAGQIIKAEAEMHKNYDDLLDQLNKSRTANGEPQIARRADYHNHISEINLLNDLGLTSKAGTEEGATLITRLKTDAEQAKASRFGHLSDILFRHTARKGLADVDDAVEGYTRYVREAERKIALQPYVNELKATAEAVKEKMPNLASYITDQADYLAGKPQAIDAAIKNLVGPEAFRGFVNATSRMKGNLIQANPNVAYSQLFSAPVITASLPAQDAMLGAVKAMSNPAFRQFLAANSPTLQLRLAERASIDLGRQGLSGKVAGVLSKPSEFIDTAMIQFALAGKFQQLVRQGASVDDALKGAEDFAASTQAMLSKVNTPPALRSQTFQATVPFMNQVLAQSRHVYGQLIKGQPNSARAIAAAKGAATALAIAAMGEAIFGKDAKSPVSLSQVVPMGPAMERGIGGPLVGGAGRVLSAKSPEDMLLQLFRNGMLLQTTIPAGLQVSKMIEGAFKSPERRE